MTITQTTMSNTATFGMERIVREMGIVLIRTINDELAHQNEVWEPLDRELASIQNPASDPDDFEPILLEEIPPEHVHFGHTPSLINAPIANYPNIAVDCDTAEPDDQRGNDHVSLFRDLVYVEFMAKSEKSEHEANARAQRLGEAINICVSSNPSLRGVIDPLDEVPTVHLADVFVRKERTSHGDKWFWRGGRIEYPIQKVASMPSGDLARPSTIMAPDIDQS